jgi:hypothetical protein
LGEGGRNTAAAERGLPPQGGMTKNKKIPEGRLYSTTRAGHSAAGAGMARTDFGMAVL